MEYNFCNHVKWLFHAFGIEVVNVREDTNGVHVTTISRREYLVVNPNAKSYLRNKGAIERNVRLLSKLDQIASDVHRLRS